MLVTAVCTTWLKPSRADSTTIDKSELCLFEKGTSLNVSQVSTLKAGHYLLTLTEAKQGFTQWYVFAEHITINGSPGSRGEGVNLVVKYFPQYDNKYEPYTSCFATSAAMAMSYCGILPKGSEALEDELYQYLVNNGLDRFSWADIATAIQDYGCIATPNMAATFADIRAALDKKQPVILGTYFTRAGHVVLVKGYNADGVIAHDPWGRALGNYEYDLTHSGEDVHYSWQFIADNASDVGGTDPGDLWIMSVSCKE